MTKDSTRGGKRRTRRHDPAAAMLAAVDAPEDALEWMLSAHPEHGTQLHRGQGRNPLPGELEVVCACQGEDRSRQIAILVPLGGWRAARAGAVTVNEGVRLSCDRCGVDVRLSVKNASRLLQWVEATAATRLDLLTLARVLST